MMIENTEKNDFGQRVRALRDKKGLSQKDLADRLGMPRSIVSTYENGRRMPTYGKLIKLAYVFGVSTDYLLGVENDRILDLSGLNNDQTNSIKDIVEAMS